jgi:hypothetical protein
MTRAAYVAMTRAAEIFRAGISAVNRQLVDPQSRNGAGEAH